VDVEGLVHLAEDLVEIASFEAAVGQMPIAVDRIAAPNSTGTPVARAGAMSGGRKRAISQPERRPHTPYHSKIID